MTLFIYDGTYAGLLTAVFEVYERRCREARLVSGDRMEALALTGNIAVHTDAGKAARVLKGLSKKVSQETVADVYRCFLSELKGMEDTILEFVRYVFSSAERVEENYGHPAVLWIAQTSRKVAREKHRFEAFVRFETIGPSFFYAPIDPDYNVLPLIVPHFKRRYADQHWVIYDTKRGYGMHYDKDSERVQEITMKFTPYGTQEPAPAQLSLDAEQPVFESLWKTYFKSTNIESRKNLKLHVQHVPKRYWKYLVEKQPS